jgi:hypothetical protein
MAADGYVEQLPEGGFNIALRIDRAEQRRRFSLAHELAHIILHKLSAAPESILARHYRANANVSLGADVEAMADLMASILLIPPSAISEFLPRGFSLQRVADLAQRAKVSLSTALIRSTWYATQPCFAFHLRRLRNRPQSLRCLWASGSRSVKTISNDLALRALDPGWLQTTLEDSCGRPFMLCKRSDPAMPRVELHRKDYFERESIFGIAYLDEQFWKTDLFSDRAKEVSQNLTPVSDTNVD